MTARRPAVHPVVTAADALQAAKAAASRKAERTPHKLTEAEVRMLPGKRVLELGNAGRLQHLGVGTAPVKSATPASAGPKATTGQPTAQPRGTSKQPQRTKRSKRT
jgi:hypothetical protein